MSCVSFIPEFLRYLFSIDHQMPMEEFSYHSNSSVKYTCVKEAKKVVEWKEGKLFVPNSVYEFRERILEGKTGVADLLGVSRFGKSDFAVKNEEERACRSLSLSLHSDKTEHIADVNAKADLEALMKIVNRINGTLRSSNL